mmetsp:Transcript_20673/g.45156  ORF Transcript_20673/g.45156 Transcript_20673/m.45156 type:complete len:302 (+) Transcript_20673:133-1038(+)|eukprot:CAMPEP_0178480814 /NCGR_PEP_ID=MMETSP0696-20121128/5891_1 /TAXON_ID=265572 /ORGANISM="Extubocellulus spinifer, Strain CCMP396" /LENGTH=301 /DNA_ID=CAMNT_0020108269 /DNA_START=101 /DNA_END=1006 /DNA_ORIENTATION=-
MSSEQLSVDLTAINGVVIHQRAHKGEFAAQLLGLPIEVQNEYAVKALPENSKVARSDKSPDLWTPTFEQIQQLDDLFVMKEESNCCSRVTFVCLGCRGVRPLDVLFLEQQQGQDTRTEKMRISKPCKCGGWICCPAEMALVDSKGDEVGYVKEKFAPYCESCYQCCCCCTFSHRVYNNKAPTAPTTNRIDRSSVASSAQPTFDLKFHLCCCQGESNNCCGATCCNQNQIFEIREPQSGMVVGNIQKLYSPSADTALAACCRCTAGFDTYAIGFPEGTSQAERLMLIAGVMQAEFFLFEQGQ